MPSGGGHIIRAMVSANFNPPPDHASPTLAHISPTDEAATKLIYLAIRKFEKDGRNVREWFAARNQFAIMFGERFDA